MAKTHDDLMAELGAQSRTDSAIMVNGYRVVVATAYTQALSYARAAQRRKGKKDDDDEAIAAALLAQNATILSACVVDDDNKPLAKYGEWIEIMRTGNGIRIDLLLDAATKQSGATDEGVAEAKNEPAPGGTDAPSGPASNSDSDTPSEEEAA